MPIPKPRETEKDFVGRCVPSVLREPKNKGMKSSQASAICQSLYRQHKRGAVDCSLFEVPILVGESETFLQLYDSPQTYFQHLDAQSGRSATEVQTLVMDKSRFPTKASALEWAKARQFKTDSVRETNVSWRMKQRSPEEFKGSSFRIVQVARAVQSVTGNLK